MFEEILVKYGLKYDDLTPVEKETVHSWVNALQQGELSTEKVKEYIGAMKDSVENELTKMGLENNQDIFLKARLRNYMLLEALLTSPEKAKAQMERAISGIVGSKGGV